MSWALTETRIDIQPIRRAVLDQHVSFRELGNRMGMTESGVRVLLGLKWSYTTHRGRRYGPYHQTTIIASRAAELIRAAGLDPIDVGL